MTVDPSSAADFLPATFGSHTGLTLVSPDEFTIDVTGDAPVFLDNLIIDVSFVSAATTPLPGALPLFATGLGALGLLSWRRKRKNGANFSAA